jgi:hypothetical protein
MGSELEERVIRSSGDRLMAQGVIRKGNPASPMTRCSAGCDHPIISAATLDFPGIGHLNEGKVLATPSMQARYA